MPRVLRQSNQMILAASQNVPARAVPTQESAAANESLLDTPVLHVAASSLEVEMASHEQPKAGKTNFSLHQPCSLLRGGTLSQLSTLHSPDYTHPHQAPKPLTPPSPAQHCPPSPCYVTSQIFGCCYLVFSAHPSGFW